MATIQATNVSNFAVVDVQKLGFTQRFRCNPLLGVMAHIGIVKQGKSSNRYLALGEFTAAAVSENAAITGSALPTLDADNGTLAQGGISYELTSQAWNSIEDQQTFIEALDKRALESLADYISSDSTVGISALIASLTAYGTSGATLTRATMRSAQAAICNAVGTMELFAVLDLKGFNDLKTSIEQSGGAMMGSDALVPALKALFASDEITDDIGYTGLHYDNIHYFLVNRGSSGLYTTGGDTYGMLAAPPNLKEITGINPAVVCDFRADPAAVRKMLAHKTENVEFCGIPVGKWHGEPNTVNANTVRISYVFDGDAFLHNASAAAAPRWVTS